MNKEIEKFLASDLLENYLLGTTTFEETQKVEHFIDTYPEIKDQYNQLQENLEAYARSFAAKPPEAIKKNVMAAITKNKAQKASRYFIAAIVATAFFAMSTFYFWDQNKTLKDQNTIISGKIKLLQENINETENKFNTIQNQYAVINNPGTQKYIFKGNKKAEKLKALAYVNPEEKASYINVINLPELPEDKCYQMWADVDGEMVSMAILGNAEDKLVAIPYKENAVSYNITIEPKGGNDHATVENLVANVFL